MSAKKKRKTEPSSLQSNEFTVLMDKLNALGNKMNIIEGKLKSIEGNQLAMEGNLLAVNDVTKKQLIAINRVVMLLTFQLRWVDANAVIMNDNEIKTNEKVCKIHEDLRKLLLSQDNEDKDVLNSNKINH